MIKSKNRITQLIEKNYGLHEKWLAFLIAKDLSGGYAVTDVKIKDIYKKVSYKWWNYSFNPTADFVKLVGKELNGMKNITGENIRVLGLNSKILNKKFSISIDDIKRQMQQQRRLRAVFF